MPDRTLATLGVPQVVHDAQPSGSQQQDRAHTEQRPVLSQHPGENGRRPHELGKHEADESDGPAAISTRSGPARVGHPSSLARHAHRRGEMRVLTVRQPWAWAIIHGGKDVENRLRSLGPYRGPVAIHAAQQLAPEALDSFMLRRAWHLAGDMPQRQTSSGMFEPVLEESYDEEASWLPLGAVIGVVDLADEHPSGDCWRKPWKWETADPVNGDYCSDWAMADHHHLVLANPRPLARPIPATGRLGLWRPDDDLLAAITVQLAEVA